MKPTKREKTIKCGSQERIDLPGEGGALQFGGSKCTSGGHEVGTPWEPVSSGSVTAAAGDCGAQPWRTSSLTPPQGSSPVAHVPATVRAENAQTANTPVSARVQRWQLSPVQALGGRRCWSAFPAAGPITHF